VNKTMAHNLSLTIFWGEPVSRMEKGAKILKSFVCLVKQEWYEGLRSARATEFPDDHV
jgi:hypothetical protein